jgi:hypothetical protein
MGFVFDLPVGITFSAGRFSEPMLIKLASGFEAALGLRRRPQFLRTFDEENPSGRRRRQSGWNAQGYSGILERASRSRDYLDQFLVPRLRRPMHL